MMSGHIWDFVRRAQIWSADDKLLFVALWSKYPANNQLKW